MPITLWQAYRGRGSLRVRSLFTLAVLVVVLTQAQPGPSEAAFPGENGRIAFASNRITPQNPDREHEIFSANPDGTGLVQLTKNDLFEFSPAWSPDGTKIAFDVVTPDDNEIYAMNADGTGRTLLADSPGYDAGPTWSPDGERIAFVSDRTGAPELYAMNADGTGQTRLTQGASAFNSPAWSPDGTKIVFNSNRIGTNSEVYVVNADGTEERNLSNSPADDAFPDWSPDGRRVVFTRHLAGTDGRFRPDLFAMDADGSNQINLTRTRNSSETWPTWSPDGTKIAFEGEHADPSTEVLIMNADGTGRTPSASSTLDALFPDWGSAPTTAPVPGPERCTIGGTEGRDVLRDTNGDDVICGLGGDDRISGLGGDDVVRGGSGDDVLIGDAGSDSLFGEGGQDVLRARDQVRGNDDLDGGRRKDACKADRKDEESGCN